MMDAKADVLYCENERRLAVTPAPGGRLDRLVHRWLGGDTAPQVWLYGEIKDWPHRPGDGVTEFFHQRGVFSGSREDCVAFVAMCRELGLVVRYETSLMVPCSGWPSRSGKDRHGGDMWDYSRREYELLRWDSPPTRDKLVELLAQVPVAPAEAASA